MVGVEAFMRTKESQSFFQDRNREPLYSQHVGGYLRRVGEPDFSTAPKPAAAASALARSMLGLPAVASDAQAVALAMADVHEAAADVQMEMVGRLSTTWGHRGHGGMVRKRRAA